MERWKYYEGKKVFIILRNGRQYSGVVLSIEKTDTSIIWITIKDKFNKRVMFANSEIDVIEEEFKT